MPRSFITPPSSLIPQLALYRCHYKKVHDTMTLPGDTAAQDDLGRIVARMDRLSEALQVYAIEHEGINPKIALNDHEADGHESRAAMLAKPICHVCSGGGSIGWYNGARESCHACCGYGHEEVAG